MGWSGSQGHLTEQLGDYRELTPAQIQEDVYGQEGHGWLVPPMLVKRNVRRVVRLAKRENFIRMAKRSYSVPMRNIPSFIRMLNGSEGETIKSTSAASKSDLILRMV